MGCLDFKAIHKKSSPSGSEGVPKNITSNPSRPDSLDDQSSKFGALGPIDKRSGLLTGFLFLITFENLIPSKKKCFVAILDGYLYCYERVVIREEIGSNNLQIARLDLTGSFCRTGATKMARPYGLAISSNKSTIEFDCDTFTLQNEWFSILQSEIEKANIEIVSKGNYSGNTGVVGWLEGWKEKQRVSIGRIIMGTPMIKHYVVMGRVRQHERIIQMNEDGKYIAWSAIGAGSKDGDKNMNVDDIVDIVEGCNSPALSKQTLDPSRRACCWSIHSMDKIIEFEAQAPSEKDRWVDNLRVIVEYRRLERLMAKNRTSQLR